MTGLLVSVLAVILSSVWRGLAVPSLSAAAQCRVAQESGFAAASLARDLGGSYPNPAGRLGQRTAARYLGRALSDSGTLTLLYDNGLALPLEVTYYAAGNQLMRRDEAAGSTLAVADGLTGFLVVPYLDESGRTGVTLFLTFSARDLTRVYTLVVLDPLTS